MVKAVRGAICIDQNTVEDIEKGVQQLIGEIEVRNHINQSQFISMVFSQTKDLTVKNPATALRKIGYAEVPLFCTQEPDYEGSAPRIVRVLITYQTENSGPAIPVYLNGAENLRKDITS